MRLDEITVYNQCPGDKKFLAPYAKVNGIDQNSNLYPYVLLPDLEGYRSLSLSRMLNAKANPGLTVDERRFINKVVIETRKAITQERLRYVREHGEPPEGFTISSF